LHKRNGFHGGPTGRARDSAGGAIRTDDAIGVQLFTLAAALDFEAQAAFIRRNTKETGVKREGSSRLPRFPGEGANQPRTLDNQIRLFEGNLRGAAVGKKFKAANFVDDGVLRYGRHLSVEMTGDNQSARGRLKLRLGLQDANRAPAAHYAGSGEESSGRGSDDNYFP